MLTLIPKQSTLGLAPGSLMSTNLLLVRFMYMQASFMLQVVDISLAHHKCSYVYVQAPSMGGGFGHVESPMNPFCPLQHCMVVSCAKESKHTLRTCEQHESEHAATSQSLESARALLDPVKDNRPAP